MVDLSNKLLLSFLLPNILKKEENNHVFEYTTLFLLKKVLIIGSHSHRIPYKKAIDPCLRLYWNVFLLIYFCNIIETMIKLNSFEIIVTYNQDHIYLSREIRRNFIFHMKKKMVLPAATVSNILFVLKFIPEFAPF